MCEISGVLARGKWDARHTREDRSNEAIIAVVDENVNPYRVDARESDWAACGRVGWPWALRAASTEVYRLKCGSEDQDSLA